jgi:hypothetical protein
MIGDSVRDRADNADAISQSAVPRQQLAHLHSLNRGRDGLELATIFSRRSGLHVIRFQVAGATLEPKQDHCSIETLAATRGGT